MGRTAGRCKSLPTLEPDAKAGNNQASEAARQDDPLCDVLPNSQRRQTMKHTKRTAGALGGRATVAKHGRGHMQQIGKRGAAVTWQRYQLSPIGQSGWEMVDR